MHYKGILSIFSLLFLTACICFLGSLNSTIRCDNGMEGKIDQGLHHTIFLGNLQGNLTVCFTVYL